MGVVTNGEGLSDPEVDRIFSDLQLKVVWLNRKHMPLSEKVLSKYANDNEIVEVALEAIRSKFLHSDEYEVTAEGIWRKDYHTHVLIGEKVVVTEFGDVRSQDWDRLVAALVGYTHSKRKTQISRSDVIAAVKPICYAGGKRMPPWLSADVLLRAAKKGLLKEKAAGRGWEVYALNEISEVVEKSGKSFIFPFAGGVATVDMEDAAVRDVETSVMGKNLALIFQVKARVVKFVSDKPGATIILLMLGLGVTAIAFI